MKNKIPQKPLETRGRIPEPPPKIVTGTNNTVKVMETKLGRASAPPPKIVSKK